MFGDAIFATRWFRKCTKLKFGLGINGDLSRAFAYGFAGSIKIHCII